MLRHVEPPRRVESLRRPRPKLDPVLPIIHQWLEADRHAPAKQRHPAEAQVDFGHAEVIINGERTKGAFFVMSLVHCDPFFVAIFPKECTEAFQEGHRRAFDFFGGGPKRITYDNRKIAVKTVTSVFANAI